MSLARHYNLWIYLMADDSSKFVPPILTKTDRRPLRVWCGHCDLPLRSTVTTGEGLDEFKSFGSGGRWILHEGGPNEPPMVFSAYCHGEEYHLGIEDVPGFYDEIQLRRDGSTAGPFVVFRQVADVET